MAWLKDGCVLWLQFDEEKGDVAYDQSGKGNNGNIHGATRVKGKIGGALSFDGVGDYVKVTHNSSLELVTDLSITAWINILAHTEFRFIAFKGYGNKSRPYEFRTRPDGELEFVLYNGGIHNYISLGSVPTNQWAYVVLTKKKGEKVKFYINGVFDVERDEGNISPATGTDDLLIGTRADAYSYFNGNIDEVRVYNRALSAKEIFSHYMYALTHVKRA